MYNFNDILKLKNCSLYGTVIDIIKTKNKLSYKMKINNKLVIVDENLIQEKITNLPIQNTNKTIGTISYNKDFTPEIMIRHLTRDEALYELEMSIDKAICNKAKIIKIIHGKNGGILRKATDEFLKSCPYVESFRLGYPHEGSYGVTVVQLK